MFSFTWIFNWKATDFSPMKITNLISIHYTICYSETMCYDFHYTKLCWRLACPSSSQLLQLRKKDWNTEVFHINRYTKVYCYSKWFITIISMEIFWRYLRLTFDLFPLKRSKGVLAIMFTVAPISITTGASLSQTFTINLLIFPRFQYKVNAYFLFLNSGPQSTAESRCVVLK